MRLVIDDERYFGEGYTYARTYDEGKKMLYSREWDQVWLDNDLGDGNKDVYELVKEIEKDFFEDGVILPIRLFIIHTANPIARQLMSEAFDDMPYPYVVLVGKRPIYGRL